MRFTKPAWVIHKGIEFVYLLIVYWKYPTDSAGKDDQKRLSIFSVHVHPDGSRIATGGLDAKIRIWSTKPILNPASELSNRPPKSLCTLTMHTGPVLAVRWAHSGRWLASGSDDQIVMIWDLDPYVYSFILMWIEALTRMYRTAKGKVWGSDEVNVEGWKPLKRLPGHESGVCQLLLCPDTVCPFGLLRCNGRSLVTRWSIPRFRWFRLSNHDLVRIHTRSAPPIVWVQAR